MNHYANRTDLPLTPRLEAAVSRLGATLREAQPLAGDGSDRRFYRLLGYPTLVLLYHPHPPGGEVNENDSYFLIGRHLRAGGAPVPEILEYCREERWMLLEDLGDVSLEAALQGGRKQDQEAYWYRQALEILAGMQVAGAEGFQTSWCFDTPVADRPFLMERECLYFVRAFLQGYKGLKVGLDDLAPDFARLLEKAILPGPDYFLHRDFQSRNLHIKNGRLRVIDFQGGRLGPLGYDAAALLIDPYVGLSPARQKELLDYYLDLITAQVHIDPAAFREQYDYLALSRNLQILGAFGFLTKVKHKDYFARYIPGALAGLRERLKARAGEFPRIEGIVANL